MMWEAMRGLDSGDYGSHCGQHTAGPRKDDLEQSLKKLSKLEESG
jgi:hypothetical protein